MWARVVILSVSYVMAWKYFTFVNEIPILSPVFFTGAKLLRGVVTSHFLDCYFLQNLFWKFRQLLLIMCNKMNNKIKWKSVQVIVFNLHSVFKQELMVFDPIWVGLRGINQEVNSNIQLVPDNLAAFTVYLYSLWTKFTLYSGPFSKEKTKQNKTNYPAFLEGTILCLLLGRHRKR